MLPANILLYSGNLTFKAKPSKTIIPPDIIYPEAIFTKDGRSLPGIEFLTSRLGVEGKNSGIVVLSRPGETKSKNYYVDFDAARLARI